MIVSKECTSLNAPENGEWTYQFQVSLSILFYYIMFKSLLSLFL